MIRDRLKEALRREFPGVPFAFGEPPDPVASLSCPCAEVGDLYVFDDGDEVTVGVTGISHSHFNFTDEALDDEGRVREIVEDVAGFLGCLFADELLLFRRPRRSQGGWRRVDRSSKEFRLPAGYDCYFWSGPASAAPRT